MVSVLGRGFMLMGGCCFILWFLGLPCGCYAVVWLVGGSVFCFAECGLLIVLFYIFFICCWFLVWCVGCLLLFGDCLLCAC